MFHPRSNVHTHTSFSDGRDSVDKMIEAALQRNFTSLGFSDHGALSVDSAGMMNDAGYHEAVRILQEKHNRYGLNAYDTAFEDIEQALESWHLNKETSEGALNQVLEAVRERKHKAELQQSSYQTMLLEEQKKYETKSEAFYRAAVLEAKEKYADQIEIALGYEHDFAAVDADLSHYDYIIESVHFLRKDGMCKPIDHSAAWLRMWLQDLYRDNWIAMCMDYYGEVCRSIEQHRPDVVGHIGLITKFNEVDPMIDESNSLYKLIAMEPIEVAAKHDTIVEINTGAMSRGYRSEPYPSLDQLKRLHELGGRITITSDCHRAEWIDHSFYKAVALAQSAGFKTVWIWENGEFREKPME